MSEILTAQKMICYPKVALLWLSSNLALNEVIKKTNSLKTLQNKKEKPQIKV